MRFSFLGREKVACRPVPQDVAALLLLVAAFPAHVALLAADFAAASRLAHVVTSVRKDSVTGFAAALVQETGLSVNVPLRAPQ
jgi:hypothetical protein